MSISVVKSSTLKNIAVNQLRLAIIDGDLKPGERLNETKLAEQMNISRGPIREAISQLKSEGLARIIPRRGSFVIQLSEDDLLEIFLIRSIVEGLAARRGAEFFNNNDFAFLQRILDVAREADEDNKGESLTIQFHEYVCRNCGLPRLFEVWRSINMQRQLFAAIASYQQDWIEYIDDHQLLLDTLKSRDPNLSEATFRSHIMKYYEILKNSPSFQKNSAQNPLKAKKS